MSIADFSPEQLNEMSMIDLAFYLLEEERQVFDFYTLAKKVAEHKGFSQENLDARIAQFYTDINIDGRFLNLGNNLWGLRRWYPVEQIDEEMTMPKKKKKKSSKKVAKPLVDDDDIYEDDTDDLESDSDDNLDDDDDDDFVTNDTDDDDLVDEEEYEVDDYDEDDFDLDDDDDDEDDDEEDEQ
ncbi:DNA-directed RNA polymerase subunit delta [Bacillus tianshenii]|nr:DNA-directed RNA polymerase subunit delta [Bacillus tianshenii]